MSKQTLTTSNNMALEQPREAFGKVSTVFATKLKSFTFLPALKKLPKENKVTLAWKHESRRQNKALGDPEASEDSMTDEGVYKAKIIYVRDSEDTEPQEIHKHSQTQLKSTVNSSPTLFPASVVAHAEIGCSSPGPCPVAMEPIDNKHPGISQQGCLNTYESAEVSPGQFLNNSSRREEEVLSPASSVDLLTSLASSKESIFSDGWERDRSWSALPIFSASGSPLSFSRTVSPCSSVRSGTFTPSVVRIKRHTLAPGSSLARMPPSSGQSVCCDSQAPSPCPMSARTRHRPPPTQLSLLTAILRKGRLPILSSALQRPYSPCWPISPVSMSSCIACSAASAVDLMEGLQAKPRAEPSQKARPKSPKLNYNNVCESHKKPNKVTTSSVPLAAHEKLDSNSSSINRVVHHKAPQDSRSLNMPFSSTYEPTWSHLSKPLNKDPHVPTVPSSLIFSSFSRTRSPSPKSSHLSCCSLEDQTAVSVLHDHSVPPVPELSRQSCNTFYSSRQGHVQKSNHPTAFPRNAEPPLDLRQEQMSCDHVTSSTHYLKPTQEFKDILASKNLKQAGQNPCGQLQNGRKTPLDLEQVLSVSPALKLSPSPRLAGLTRLAYTPPISPACPSPRPSSRSPTPDRCTLTPSPAILSRQLSPSPSYSLCSSPSPSLREGTPDCTDRADKNRKAYKIRSTYKALAAIPTNTLLLEQQAIDDKVEKNELSQDPSENFAWEDPHSQMCTPAQLRQQSAELYAAIDEVLVDTNQTGQSSPANKLTVKTAASDTSRKLTSSPSPRSLGRETKYASFQHQPSGPSERTLTKPGVIRPVIVMSRTDDAKKEEYLPNPFQRTHDDRPHRYQYKFASSMLLTVDNAEEEGRSGMGLTHGGMEPSEKARRSTSSPAVLIDQPAGRNSTQGVPTSLKPIQVKMETLETHI